MSEDPIGFAGGDFSLYRYAHNNPLRFIDPYGDLTSGARKIVNCLEYYSVDKETAFELAWQQRNVKGNQDDDLRDAEHYLFTKLHTENIADYMMWSVGSVLYSAGKLAIQPLGIYMSASLPSINEAAAGEEGAREALNPPKRGSGGAPSGCPGWCSSLPGFK